MSFDTIKEYQINVNKSYFHDFPIAESIKKSYLIVGDYINPLKTVNCFYYIEYQNSSGNTSKGWISRNDILVITTIAQADLTPQSQANNGNKSNSIREKGTDVNHEYLALTELMLIFNLENHDATTINEALKEINSQWAYYGTDSGEIFFCIKKSNNDNQMLDWHKSEEQLEYIILNPQEFISIVNQIKISGFTLAKTQLHQYEEDKGYVKKTLLY